MTRLGRGYKRHFSAIRSSTIRSKSLCDAVLLMRIAPRRCDDSPTVRVGSDLAPHLERALAQFTHGFGNRFDPVGGGGIVCSVILQGPISSEIDGSLQYGYRLTTGR